MWKHLTLLLCLLTFSCGGEPAYASTIGINTNLKLIPFELPTFTIDQPNKKEVDCLVSAIIHEAGNESVIEKRAVAHATFNRTKLFAPTVCAVVNQPGQFTWNHHHTPKIPDDRKNEITDIAISVLEGADPDLTNGANSFYNYHLCHPSWSRHAPVTFRTRKVAYLKF